MTEREPALDLSQLDAPTRRVVESMRKVRKNPGRATLPSASERDAAAGWLAVWADENSRRHRRKGVNVASHELLEVSEKEYGQMAKKRPWVYLDTPTGKRAVEAARVYHHRRPGGR